MELFGYINCAKLPILADLVCVHLTERVSPEDFDLPWGFDLGLVIHTHTN